MGGSFDRHIDAMFKTFAKLIDPGFEPSDRLIEIGLDGEIGQHMLQQRLGVRLRRLAVDAGGFERFRVGGSIDRHLDSSAGRVSVSLESIKRVALDARPDERLQAAAVGDIDTSREQIREVLRNPDIFEKPDRRLRVEQEHLRPQALLTHGDPPFRRLSRLGQRQ